MTIQQTKIIIIGWIDSCETSEQLRLLDSAIKDFWMKPFEIDAKSKPRKRKQPVSIIEVEAIQWDLLEAIEKKKLVIAAKPTQTGVPTLDRYNPAH